MRAVHRARTNSRRHAAREHAVQHDDDGDENSRHDGAQAQERTEPSHDCRQQRDMRAGHRKDVHDARCREGLDKLGLYALVAAEEHGEDRRRIFLGHHALH